MNTVANMGREKENVNVTDLISNNLQNRKVKRWERNTSQNYKGQKALESQDNKRFKGEET